MFSYPDTPYSIKESYIKTSFRKKNYKLDLEGSAKKNALIELSGKIAETSDFKKPVQVFDAAIEANKDGNWKTTVGAGWANPKLWQQESPNLYFYSVSLSVNGKVVDKLLPRRFGFKEIWIEDGSFVLNGKPATFVDDVWEGGLDKGNANYKQALKMKDILGEWGINSGYRIKSKVVMDAADETGMMYRIGCGSFVKINIWDTKSGLTSMTGDENKEDIERYVKKYREHPSIICWASNTAYALASMHPQYAGQWYNSWDFFPLNRCKGPAKEAQEIFKELVDMMAELDTEREVATHNGPYSKIETATRYLCDNLDMQEREEFFQFWYNSGPDRKVVWCSEFGIPFASHQYLRPIDHVMPQGGNFPQIYAENAARLYGDEEYLALPDSKYDEVIRTKFYDHMQEPQSQKMTAMNVKAIWRAWRTYGINASGHHILRENCHFKRDKSVTVEQRFGFNPADDDPRRPGLSTIVNSTYIPMPEFDGHTVSSKAYADACTPLLAYIGGTNGIFTTKDHLYFSENNIGKNIVVVNDRDETAKITAKWTLVDDKGKTVKSGKVSGEVKPGYRDTKNLLISFETPEVSERTDYTLNIDCKSNLEGMLTDSFAITVFPKHETPKVEFAGNIWTVNISDDVTHESPHFFINRDNKAFLEAAGIDSKLVSGLKTFTWMGYSPAAAMDMYKGRTTVTNGMPKPGDILIIPRHTLETGKDNRQLVLRLLQKMKLDKLVEQGLKVVIFEQNTDNLMGLETENVRPRRAFIAANGHPVFEGLADSDLSYWTGASTLETGITAYSPDLNRFPERLWHTSNNNSVASKTYIRPQIGSARALAVSGFDLQESPLLEVTRGKGRIIFCSFDVTSRYGIDPAATKLVDNIFAYITTVKDANPEKSEIQILEPGEKGVVVEAGVIRAAKPKGEYGWGITQGELFFRESIYDDNKPTSTMPAGEIPVFADSNQTTNPGIKLPEVIRFDEEKGVYQTTMDVNNFKTGWTKRKIMWLNGAMIVNQGGSIDEGPSIMLQGNPTALYPYVWVDNFVHPYTANIW
ncbi:MAG: hypothetical protein PF692_10520 [Kiritimatiellae bacterium]|jgi:hypothetical protein|nr:hypothetical protein [Kiritimatiellia bacterium]